MASLYLVRESLSGGTWAWSCQRSRCRRIFSIISGCLCRKGKPGIHYQIFDNKPQKSDVPQSEFILPMTQNCHPREQIDSGSGSYVFSKSFSLNEANGLKMAYLSGFSPFSLLCIHKNFFRHKVFSPCQPSLNL